MRRAFVGLALALALVIVGALVGSNAVEQRCPTEDSCDYVHGEWVQVVP